MVPSTNAEVPMNLNLNGLSSLPLTLIPSPQGEGDRFRFMFPGQLMEQVACQEPPSLGGTSTYHVLKLYPPAWAP